MTAALLALRAALWDSFEAVRKLAELVDGMERPPIERCEVCGRSGDDACCNTINPGSPLPGRAYHHARKGA